MKKHVAYYGEQNGQDFGPAGKDGCAFIEILGLVYSQHLLTPLTQMS
jgi:hypothetical protein